MDKSNKKIKVVIWDYDGTLYDTLPSIIISLVTIQKKEQLPPISSNEIKNAMERGGTIEDVLNRLWDIPKHNLELLISKYRDNNAVVSPSLSQPFPGVFAAVKELNEQEIKQIIVSHKGQRALVNLLNHSNLINYFDIIIGTEPDKPKKPEQALFKEIINPEYPNLKPENFCMIGDTVTDYLFAKNCGMSFIYCEYGYGNERELTTFQGAFLRCHNASEIPRIINAQ
jgi:phosphoglycolate phosphatase